MNVWIENGPAGVVLGINATGKPLPEFHRVIRQDYTPALNGHIRVVREVEPVK